MERLPASPAYRNDAPDLVASRRSTPRVIFSWAEGSFRGFVAARTGQRNWWLKETPFALAVASGALASEGRTLVAADDGALGARLYRQQSDDLGDWDEGVLYPEGSHSRAGNLHCSPDELPMALIFGPSGRLSAATYDGRWTDQFLTTSVQRVATSALSASGKINVAFYAYGTPVGEMRWVSSTHTEETVTSYGRENGHTTWLEDRFALTVGPADPVNPFGRPHLLLAHEEVTAQTLSWASRAAEGSWAVVQVAANDNASALFCEEWPAAGDECDFDFEELWPLGIVASQGGDVRVLFTQIRFQGHKVTVCIPGDDCIWSATQEDITAELYMGWPEGEQGFEVTSVGPIAPLMRATVRLDGDGRIHIAGYAAVPLEPTQSEVFYARIEP